jgi:hypothetical protein
MTIHLFINVVVENGILNVKFTKMKDIGEINVEYELNHMWFNMGLEVSSARSHEQPSDLFGE